MDNGIVLFTTLLITVVLGIIIQIVLYKHRKKQKEEYPMLWSLFEISLKVDSHEEIIELGNKLIYNKFVPTKHLEIIQKAAQDLESKNPAFEKLRLNAFDKWIHHTKGQGYVYLQLLISACTLCEFIAFYCPACHILTFKRNNNKNKLETTLVFIYPIFVESLN